MPTVSRARGACRPRWLCLCALAAVTGCVGASDGSRRTTVTDSAGVMVVVSEPEDRMLSWTFERVIDLGSEGDGPTAFFRVFPTSIGVDSLRNLYVLDAGRFHVSVFDPRGTHLLTFGRQGEGPGELGFPSDIAVTRGGQSSVYDFARRALVRFEPDGEYAGEFGIPGPLQRKVAVLNDGRVIAAVTEPSASADSLAFRLLSLGADTLELARMALSNRFPAQQFSCGVRTAPPLFTPRIVWAASGDRVAISVDASYSVQIVEDGRVVGDWRRDLSPIPSTLELAAWEIAEGDSLRFRGCVVSAEEAASKFGFERLVPLVLSLAVTPEGGVWVLRRTGAPGQLLIDVLDPTGQYLGTLPWRGSFPALFRSGDEVVTVERDGFDVPHVVVSRVRKER